MIWSPKIYLSSVTKFYMVWRSLYYHVVHDIYLVCHVNEQLSWCEACVSKVQLKIFQEHFLNLPFVYLKAMMTKLCMAYAAWTSRRAVVHTEYHRRLGPRYRRIPSSLIRRWGKQFRRVRPLRMSRLSILRTPVKKDSTSPSTMMFRKSQNRLWEWRERLLKR